LVFQKKKTSLTYDSFFMLRKDAFLQTYQAQRNTFKNGAKIFLLLLQKL